MSWAPAGAERFGLFDTGAANPVTVGTGLSAMSTPAAAYAAEGKPWSPHSPLFAFAAVGLLTFGLMAVSTSGGASVRLGKTTATVAGGVGVGKS